MPAADSTHSRGLAFVGGFKLLEAGLLVLLAFGAFHLLHRDVEQVLERWLRLARIDPGNRFFVKLLAQAGLIDDHRLRQIGGLTLAYAALFFVEGLGLLYRRRWAEYLTIIATASFIPFEIYEMAMHPSSVKLAVLAGNVGIVIYLIAILRKNSGKAGSQGSKA